MPLIHDIGSGLLLDAVQLGLPAGEPTPQASLEDGSDIVTMSGDKLLGGPQCGIILGSSALIDAMRSNPLCRALRVDKLTLAALAATLRLYLEPARALREIPVLRMLTLDAAVIESRAAAIAAQCPSLGFEAHVVAGTSAVGGGAGAAVSIPTSLLLIARSGMSADGLERRLRAGTPAVVTRIVDDCVAIDLRTVDEREEPLLLRALAAV